MIQWLNDIEPKTIEALSKAASILVVCGLLGFGGWSMMQNATTNQEFNRRERERVTDGLLKMMDAMVAATQKRTEQNDRYLDVTERIEEHFKESAKNQDDNQKVFLQELKEIRQAVEKLTPCMGPLGC